MTFEKAISKTQFMNYLRCPGELWLSLHWTGETKVISSPEIEAVRVRKVEGVAVEDESLKLFPNAVHPSGERFTEKKNVTWDLVTSPDPPDTIYQAAFVAPNRCLAIVDFLKWNEDINAWDIYEVKSNSNPNNTLYEDIAFQTFVLTSAGLRIGRSFLVLRSKAAPISFSDSPESGFNFLEVTDKVGKILEDKTAYEDRLKSALAVLDDQASNDLRRAAKLCTCWTKVKAQRCHNFPSFHPRIPEYSIFDVRADPKLRALYPDLFAKGLYSIESFPKTYESRIASKTVDLIRAYQNKTVSHDRAGIASELQGLEFPIYFLDYETISSANPRYAEVGAWQKVPFQYSVHVLTARPDSDDAELLHFSFLAKDQELPTPKLLKKLSSEIGPEGSIVVWSKNFEKTCNKDMANLLPQYSDFLLNVNERIYDLSDVFRKKLVLDPRLKGKHGLKTVAEVLTPDVSYGPISDGLKAMQYWISAVFDPTLPEEKREKIFAALLRYSAADTWAVLRIFEILWGMAFSSPPEDLANEAQPSIPEGLQRGLFEPANSASPSVGKETKHSLESGPEPEVESQDSSAANPPLNPFEGLTRIERIELVDSKKTPNGKWTKAQLAEWGVPWPQPKGWWKQIIDRGELYSGLNEEKLEGWVKPAKSESKKLKQKREAEAERIRKRKEAKKRKNRSKSFAQNKRAVESGETFRSQKSSDYKRKHKDPSAIKPYRGR